MQKKILLLGLDLPLFAKEEQWVFNPAAKAAMLFDGRQIGNEYTIIGGKLPWGSDFGHLRRTIQHYIADDDLRLGIILGPHNQTEKIIIETTATNQHDGIYADCLDHRLIKEGVDVRSTTLPIDLIYRQLQKESYHVATSDDCYKQSCNAAYYILLHEWRYKKVPACFCHIPHVPGMRAEPIQFLMDFDVLVDTLQRLLDITVVHI